MPRKDGQPTAAERRERERHERNARFIAERSDDELSTLEVDYLLDADTRAQLAAERERRGLSAPALCYHTQHCGATPEQPCAAVRGSRRAR